MLTALNWMKCCPGRSSIQRVHNDTVDAWAETQAKSSRDVPGMWRYLKRAMGLQAIHITCMGGPSSRLSNVASASTMQIILLNISNLAQ
jgi:hypothetical protein